MPRNPTNRVVTSQSQRPLQAPVAVVLIQLSPAQAAWQQHVYQLALAKAQAALATPRYIRRFLASMIVSTEISAGDTPEILAACPKDNGRISSSFSLDSLDRLDIEW